MSKAPLNNFANCFTTELFYSGKQFGKLFTPELFTPELFTPELFTPELFYNGKQFGKLFYSRIVLQQNLQLKIRKQK